MDVLFPFGFPAATALYMTAYELTLVVHVAFMNYVLGGSAYLAVSGLRRRRFPRDTGERDVAADVLRDWLPFAIGAAITAGVAPLVFLQILYRENFYTANLLLLHRWMAIVPVLMVGFYLAYVLKSPRVEERAPRWRWLVGLGLFACMAFTAWSWTENHVLALRRDVWTEFYASSRIIFRDVTLVPRLLMWATGALPTMALLVAWQVRRHPGDCAACARRLSRLALAGLAASAACAAWYGAVLADTVRMIVISPLAGAYAAAAGVGAVVQIIVWLRMGARRVIDRRGLVVASIGLAATLVGMTIVREAIRLAQIDIVAHYPRHAAAAGKGGFWVFAAAVAACAALIAWSIRIGLRASRPGQEQKPKVEKSKAERQTD